MLPFERYQRFTTAGVLTTGQAQLDLMPAATGYTYAVVNASIVCLVQAAKETYLGDSTAAKKAMIAPASVTTGYQDKLNLSGEGFKVTKSDTLVLKPESAGPSFHVIVEGYIEKDSEALGSV